MMGGGHQFEYNITKLISFNLISSLKKWRQMVTRRYQSKRHKEKLKCLTFPQVDHQMFRIRYLNKGYTHRYVSLRSLRIQ